MKEKEFEIKKRNSLFRFPKEVEFKDLAPIFPELFDLFMDLADQYPEDSGEEYIEMLIRLNLKDLEQNRKPVGHNREARYRMIFPLDRDHVEFFIYPRIDEEESEIDMITSEISDFLDKNDLKHEIIWNEMRFLKEEKE
ncbi:MAG: hypothetical protein R6W73_00550 [Candidatus Saliniplasma sp.]